MSDIIKVSDLSFERMKSKDLKEYALSQYNTIEILKRENDSLQEKVSHLEALLSQVPITKAFPLTDEEIICIEQINIIKTKSAMRELSLDEVKRLDLLIKNLRLIREQPTQVVDSLDYSAMKEADLVAALISPNTDS